MSNLLVDSEINGIPNTRAADFFPKLFAKLFISTTASLLLISSFLGAQFISFYFIVQTQRDP